VITLGVIIGILLLAGGVGAAVKSTSNGDKVATARPPSSESTTTTEPGSSSTASPSTQPSTTTAPTTPPGSVAPVSPLYVPPVTTQPIVPQPLNLSPAVISAMVNPAVVDIDTRLAYQNAIAAGTGMVLTSTGVVLTNNHVIDGATTIGAVSIGNGRSYSAHVLGVDPSEDVAVIQLEGASGLRTINAAGTVVKRGDPVVAIGNAGGVGGPPTVTTGVVQAVDQSIIASDPAAGTSEQLDGLIATSAALHPGDSGGPLVNGSGQVIGMDTAASVPGQSAVTVSFAIPIQRALDIARQIQAGQASSTIRLGLPPFLGVQVAPGSGAGGRSGALVSAVVVGGPAAAAGILAGSLIVSINGQPVDSGPGLTTLLRQFRPGDSVTVNWIGPSGNARSARVTLGTGPAD
jgi:S1-C subfamily serine protease